MPYPEEICKPMREDLTNVGFVELKNAEQVSDLLDKKEGSALVMNLYGCAAGNARPRVKLAKTFDKKPDVFATVFAG